MMFVLIVDSDAMPTHVNRNVSAWSICQVVTQNVWNTQLRQWWTFLRKSHLASGIFQSHCWSSFKPLWMYHILYKTHKLLQQQPHIVRSVLSHSPFASVCLTARLKLKGIASSCSCWCLPGDDWQSAPIRATLGWLFKSALNVPHRSKTGVKRDPNRAAV